MPSMTPVVRPTVELVYADDCPNVTAARKALLHAFSAADLEPHWREWRVDDPERPRRLDGLGSPTILVGGCDVAGPDQPAAADCCRVYDDAGKLSGVPAVHQIAAALRNATRAGTHAGAMEGEMKTVRLKIEGMHCEGCADTIRALLSQETGVGSASVSYSSGQGRIIYDPATTNEPQLIKVIERAGYRASSQSTQATR